MSKEVEKTFYVAGTTLATINGEIHVPTVLCFDNSKKYFGYEAVSKEAEGCIINQNFKIQLGEYSATVLKDKILLFDCQDGNLRSSYALTKEFFDQILTCIEGQGIVKHEKSGLKIIVAEPLAFQMEEKGESWIKNYRDNIRRILNYYENVEFLPEPFAVYQYYRYGLRIPQIVEKVKNIALILDFGGGTFDVSIIETTNTGDITMGQKNSKPHAASSDPIGGFFINKEIAKYLIARNSEESERRKILQCIDSFDRVQKGTLDLFSLNIEKQNIIRNLKKLISLIEKSKIELCKKIKNWDLEAECYEKVNIEVPDNPFSDNSNWKSTSLYGHELRKIFKNSIWDQHLKRAINQAIKRAGEKLNGKYITVTLISGGSSNIRWLEKHLIQDFYNELRYAKPIPLSESFQEIVAKGLAIECARRNYNPDSEFVSVTYNPVRLILRPDDKDNEETIFKSIENKVDMDNAVKSILLPSAQSLQNFIDEPLQWKFKLNHPPRQKLKYFFMRPSDLKIEDQIEDHGNIYNIDNQVYTPKETDFDKNLKIELVVKADGTAYPKFIYKTPNAIYGVNEISTEGKPFVLDMTSECIKTDVSRYIGFDFGTSNSAVCFLSNEQIEALEIRNKDSSWLELKEVVLKLPFPVSYPLRKYLSFKDQNQLVEDARDAFEALLGYMAYVASAELLSRGELHNLFKGFTHRSMGPLKNLLENCLKKLGKNSIFSKEFIELFDKHRVEIDNAILQLNNHKHKKLSAEKVNVHHQLKVLSNLCLKSFKEKTFGFVDQLQPKKFQKNSYYGIFRSTIDNQPFLGAYSYEGSLSFSSNEPLLVDLKTGKTLSLFPFYYFEECTDRIGGVKCLVFDKNDKSGINYKCVDSDNSNTICEPELIEIHKEICINTSFSTELYEVKLQELNA